ncbi:MAG: replication restart helicase PriA, partial [Fimbriimonas sp.]
SERLGNWIRIRSGEAAVIVGARSAIFAPSANLGLIVLDEEHEGSYKQENVPRYHAKMAAQFLAEWHNCPLVLGSATPSAESFYEAEQERITLLSLPVRAATAQLPEVILKDLTEGFRHGKPALLTPELHERMADVLAKGQQVILFLNRRAYAPFLVCRDCGHQIRCQECSVSLSYHRRDLRLKCHQCGHQERAPDVCPKCAGLRLSPLGIGTERVEEAISSHFPDAVVARLDRDMAAKKGAVEDVLARFRSGDIHVLVGTQMVAKGLDFPNVTLVGVIAADVSLNLPDFRASERTFQLLSQVAGRAGRGQIAGHVVVQTFNPEHPSVVSAQAHDFIRFYEALREERREAGYPPFSKLINITFVGAERRDVVTASDRSAVLLGPLRGSLKASILGPADCALERLQGLWRRHLLVKLPPGTSAKPVEEALTTLGLNGVQMTLDVDPYSMM